MSDVFDLRDVPVQAPIIKRLLNAYRQAVFVYHLFAYWRGNGSDSDCDDVRVSRLTVDRLEESEEWLVVELSSCPSANASAIQVSVARWMNEECATAIKCCLKATLQQSNVIVGEQYCSQRENFINLLAVKERDFPPGKGNTISSQLLGAVIRSREHLLSTLLHSDLKSITVRRLPSESVLNYRHKQIPFLNIVLILIFVLLCLSVVLFVVRQLLRRRSSRDHAHPHIALRSSLS
uniref:Transmembrane protein n=1 Tax=Ascaris lumbricoides TaxID=6252 RepID=A0A0M3HSX1_ASCLU